MDWHPVHGPVKLHQAAMCRTGFQLETWQQRLGGEVPFAMLPIRVSGWLLVEHRRRERRFGIWHRVKAADLLMLSTSPQTNRTQPFWLVDPATANWVALVISPPA